jgi:hypothetical protein
VVRVRVTDPRAVAELIESLERADCVAERESADTCIVWHPHARSPGEARVEIAFFAKAWRSGAWAARAAVVAADD